MNKKNILILVLLLFLNIGLPVYSSDYQQQPPTKKDLKQLDKEIATRLKLSTEQIAILKENREKNLKSMENTIKKMEILRKKIHDTYIIGIPKFQADVRTAPMKMELAILKQNADKIRTNNRKKFESILTDEQKVEFEKMKKEFEKNKEQNPR